MIISLTCKVNVDEDDKDNNTAHHYGSEFIFVSTCAPTFHGPLIYMFKVYKNNVKYSRW